MRRQSSVMSSDPVGTLCAIALLTVILPAHGAADTGSCRMDDFRVAIDIGHSPARPGATSARGIGEHEFNRVMATDVYRTLQERGFSSAFLINEEGEEITLGARTAAARSRRADVFLSVHHDSVQPRYLQTWTVQGRRQRYSDDFRGFSLFVSRKNPQPAESRRLAHALGGALIARGLRPSLHHAEPIEGENRELLDAERGIYRFDELIVLKTATMPAVLLEVGIIVNRDEEAKLGKASFRGLVAEAVADAVTAFCWSVADEAASDAAGTGR